MTNQYRSTSRRSCQRNISWHDPLHICIAQWTTVVDASKEKFKEWQPGIDRRWSSIIGETEYRMITVDWCGWFSRPLLIVIILSFRISFEHFLGASDSNQRLWLFLAGRTVFSYAVVKWFIWIKTFRLLANKNLFHWSLVVIFNCLLHMIMLISSVDRDLRS